MISFYTVPAHAEIAQEKYAAVKKSESFKIYLYGVGTGYSWANSNLLSKRHLPPLYCEPGNVGLNAENYLQILDNYLSKPKTKDIVRPEFPLEMILLMALEDALPCY